LLGEISITSDMQMTPPLWQKVKKNKELIGLPKVERKIPLGGELNSSGWKSRMVTNLTFGARVTWVLILALPLGVQVGHIA